MSNPYDKLDEDGSAKRSSRVSFDTEQAGPDPHNSEHEPHKKKYCGLFTIWQLAAVVAVSIGIILLILYLISPKLAQPVINKTTISFNELTIMEPDSEAQTFRLLADTTFSAPPLTSKIHSTTLFVAFDGKNFGKFHMDTITLKSGGPTRVQMDTITTIVDLDTFNQASAALLTQDSVTWRIHGDVKLTSMGLVFPYANSLSKSVQIKGFNGLVGQITTDGFQILAGEGSKTLIQVTNTIVNPSTVNINGLGTLTLEVFFHGQLVARPTADDVNLNIGQNSLQATGEFLLEDQDLIDELFSTFARGLDQTFQVSTINASQPLFASSIPALPQVDVVSPGDTVPLIRGGVQTSPPDLSTFSADNPFIDQLIRFELQNTFETDVALTELHFNVSLNDLVFAAVNTTLDPPIIIPGKDTVLTDEMLLAIPFLELPDPSILTVLTDSSTSATNLNFSTNGFFGLSIAGITATVTYNQTVVPSCVCVTTSANPTPSQDDIQTLCGNRVFALCGAVDEELFGEEEEVVAPEEQEPAVVIEEEHVAAEEEAIQPVEEELANAATTNFLGGADVSGDATFINPEDTTNMNMVDADTTDMNLAAPDTNMNLAAPDITMNLAAPDITMNLAAPDITMNLAAADTSMDAVGMDTMSLASGASGES